MAAVKKEKTKKQITEKIQTSRKRTPGKRKISDLLKERKFKRLIILLVLFILLGFGLYYGKSLFFAAIVNGRPIPRLKIIKELEKQGGRQALDAIITKELIFQEAQKQSIDVSGEEVQAEIQKISQQIEAQGSTLDAALTLQGQTRESLEENIRIQKTVEKLLKNDIQVSEEDMKKYFDENKSLYGKDAKYEDLKDEIKQQLDQQKLSEAFKTWIEKLRSESNIIYFVNY